MIFGNLSSISNCKRYDVSIRRLRNFVNSYHILTSFVKRNFGAVRSVYCLPFPFDLLRLLILISQFFLNIIIDAYILTISFNLLRLLILILISQFFLNIVIVAFILMILSLINACVFIDKVVDVNRYGDKLCGGIFWLRKRVFKLRRLVWLNHIFHLITTLT